MDKPDPIFTDEEFEELVEEYTDMAKNAIAKMETKLLDPMLIIHNNGKPVLIDMAAAFVDDDLKFEGMEQAGAAMFEAGVYGDLIVLCSEVWMSDNPMVDPDNNQPILKPSEDPFHTEAIAISAMSVDKKLFMALFDLVRDSSGNIHMGEQMRSFSSISKESEEDMEAPILSRFFQGFAKAWFSATQTISTVDWDKAWENSNDTSEGMSN